jgi:hypothetical protein
MMTLMQTGKIARDEVVVLLYGEEYWRKVLNFETLMKYGTISPEDAELFTYCSDVGEAFAFLKKRLLKFCKSSD